MIREKPLVHPLVWKTAQSIAWYYFNVGSLEFVKTLQKRLDTEFHPSYEQEQMEKFQRGFPFHFGELDHNRQQILLEMIIERYVVEADKRHKLLFDDDDRYGDE